MSAGDLMLWAVAVVAFVLALNLAGAIVALFTRFVEEQRANLAGHRAQQAQRIAQAKAAEQRAELEAADVLERRLALPFGQRTTSLGEQLQDRMDQATGVIAKMQHDQAAMARQVAALQERLEHQAAVTHTDRPLRTDGGQR